jgi:hypothetical protein
MTMRIVLIILGIAAMGAALSHPIFCLHSTTDVALHICGGVAFVAVGIGCLVAAAKRYRGHWAFVTGVALIAVGVLGLGAQIDDARTGQSEDVGFKMGLILFFFALGTLSLWSGHKLHRCSLELDRFKNAPSEHAPDKR